MEVKIGVQHASRELSFEVSESAEDVEKAVQAAISATGATEGVLALTDSKGRRILGPAAKIAFVEIGSATMGAVGFRS